jgi:hypothetical protein
MIVGDQPSTSEWGENHPNRRVFYDTLLRVGAADAHITDLYKKRGPPGDLAKAVLAKNPPIDLPEHLSFFRTEVSLLRPTRIVAMGKHAHQLLELLVPETRPTLRYLWHFAYVAYCPPTERSERIADYERRMREAFEF